VLCNRIAGSGPDATPSNYLTPMTIPGGWPCSRAGMRLHTDQRTAPSLWIFGGGGDAPDRGLKSDMWSFSTSDYLWTWIKGSTGRNLSAVYGDMGLESSLTTPMSVQHFGSALTPDNVYWLHGGIDANGNLLGDIWSMDLKLQCPEGSYKDSVAYYTTECIPCPAWSTAPRGSIGKQSCTCIFPSLPDTQGVCKSKLSPKRRWHWLGTRDPRSGRGVISNRLCGACLLTDC
jgi:hypothetical protein